MKLKTGGQPRTWHSLWDEMFSTFDACDPNTDLSPTDFLCVELEAFRPSCSDVCNDNARLDGLDEREPD